LKVLLDENLPHQLRAQLPGFDVSTAVYAGFGGFKNGELLNAAKSAGYDVLLTGDLSLEYQQNIAGRKIAIVSLSANSWRIVQHQVPAIAKAIATAQPGSFLRVDCGRYRALRKPQGPAQQ
jgi:predicted nuclease of predicted toxin-antitoxin system